MNHNRTALVLTVAMAVFFGLMNAQADPRPRTQDNQPKPSAMVTNQDPPSPKVS